MRRITIDHRRFGALLALLLAAAVAVSLLALVGTKPAEAAFSGTNGKIVFTSDRDGVNQEIYMMDADPATNDATRLTNNGQVFDGNPVFSPSGTKIAFDSVRDPNNVLNDDIYLMDASDTDLDGNGDNLKKLTKKTASDTQPAFSADGRKIAFVSDRADPGEKLDIYVMKAKPEGMKNRPRNLTKTPAFDDYDPSFCSNGDKIVFTSLRDEVNDDGNENIYVMNSDGTGVTQLTSNPAFDADANFNPDCTKIVFRSGRVSGDPSEVFEMDAVDNNNDGEGDNMRNISNYPTANDAFPAYSPDGLKIVFRSHRTTGTGVNNTDGDAEVFVINDDVNLTGLTQLTVNDDADNFPDWGVVPT